MTNEDMLRWLPSILALVVALLALLTTVRAPGLTGWKLAILVGEFGHYLVLVPVGIALFAWRAEAGPLLRWTAIGLSLLAAVFLLKPVGQAWGIARELPRRMDEAFGPFGVSRAPLSLGQLLTGAAAPRAMITTRVFTGPGAPVPLSLDFYAPAMVRVGGAPCIMVIHGGGWDGGGRGELPELNHHLAALGYAVASIDYRLAPQSPWPAQRDDILSAVTYLKTHAAELAIDPQRLVLFGRSAGGNLAESVAYGAGDPAIRGVVAFYAPADLNFAWENSHEGDVLDPLKLLRQFTGGTPVEKGAAFAAASGYHQVGRTSPPTLLVHGVLDTITWHLQSERLAGKMETLGVPHALVSLPWATHAFDYNINGPGGQLATYAVERFLAAVTK